MTIAMGRLWILSGVICSFASTTHFIYIYVYMYIYCLFPKMSTHKYHQIIQVKKKRSVYPIRCTGILVDMICTVP